MSQCDANFDLKINVSHSDLYFMGPVTLSYILKTIWYMKVILKILDQYDTKIDLIKCM